MSASCRSNLVVLIAISRPAGGVRLTATERQVVRLLALGCDARRIATLLRRDVAVVRGCTARAMRKIGAETRAALARWARGHGVSPPGDRLSVPEQLTLRRVGG
jgi:DNA-binding CsgD family transcriptional regulator